MWFVNTIQSQMLTTNMEKLPQKVKEVTGGVHNLEDVMMDQTTMERNLGGPECETMMAQTYEAQNSLSPFKK